MKFLIVLAVVAFVVADAHVLTEEKRAKLNEIKDQCLPETGAATDVLDKLIGGDFSNDDKPTKCFVKCFYQKLGFFDKDDNLVVKTIVEKVGADFGAEKVEQWITPCKDIEQKDPCDKAFEIAQCFHKNKHPKETKQ